MLKIAHVTKIIYLRSTFRDSFTFSSFHNVASP